ncbi:uncharacterized protein [Coffea arabica]|uniref:Retrotransposon gag domain-containing protein n=1 Tax=Coffea arabica TaxID=13443 RepID=A0ABM4VC16_COFAR
MTDILERLAERQGPGPLNQTGGQDRGEDRAFERFLKFNPPKFIGEPDPEVADNWLERMTNIFANLDYTENRRVNFAAFQFEGVARAWWDVIRGKWERAQTPWTWENFTREFNEKFLPPLIQEKRDDEFIKLKQGTLCVAEYEGKFTKLSKYAPELVARFSGFAHQCRYRCQMVFSSGHGKLSPDSLPSLFAVPFPGSG